MAKSPKHSHTSHADEPAVNAAPDESNTEDATESNPDAGAPAVLTVGVSEPTVEFRGFTLDLSKVPPSGMLYLAAYGFNKSLQDCVSGWASGDNSIGKVFADHSSDKAKARFETLAKKLGKTVAEAESMTADEFVDESIHAAMTERFNAILAGTVGVRQGGGRPARTPLEKEMRRLATEALRNSPLVKAKKVKLPPAGDQFNAFVDAWLEKNGDAIRPVAENNLAMVARLAADTEQAAAA